MLNIKSKIFCLLISLFLIISCTSDKGAKGRSVFLAGGNAWNLFSKYVDYLKEQNVKYSLRNMTVHFFDGEQARVITYNWQDMLRGESDLKTWEGKLKKYEAVYNETELNKAKNLKMDIFSLAEQATEIIIDGKPIIVASAQAKKGEISEQKPTSEASKSVASKNECSPDAKRYIDLGVQFAMNKKYEEAIKEFKEAISVSPKCALAYANLISAYIKSRNYNLAIDTYKEGIEKAGDDGFLHYTGAIAHIHRKEYDYALISIEKAIINGFTDPKYYKEADLQPFAYTARFLSFDLFFHQDHQFHL